MTLEKAGLQQMFTCSSHLTGYVLVLGQASESNVLSRHILPQCGPYVVEVSIVHRFVDSDVQKIADLTITESSFLDCFAQFFVRDSPEEIVSSDLIEDIVYCVEKVRSERIEVF